MSKFKTTDEIEAALAALIDDVESGRLTGALASMRKWEILTEADPVQAINTRWDKFCGLCHEKAPNREGNRYELDFNCDCPLSSKRKPCFDRASWEAMKAWGRKINDPVKWHKSAVEFYNWMRKRLEKAGMK